MMIAKQYIGESHPVKQVLDVVSISSSSYYYKPKQGRKGRSKSIYTYTQDGTRLTESEVLTYIKEVLSEEFVDYGYLKVTHWLRQHKDCVINAKKVYRIMSEHGLLNKNKPKKRSNRQWVKQLVPPAKQAFDYLQIDIKYVYVGHQRRNALIQSVIDVKTRWILGHIMKWSINKHDVINLFDQIFAVYPMAKQFYVRNDNGTQFTAAVVQQYFEHKENVVQEFCKPATPQQNAHIESYHSIMERVVCQRFEFENLPDCQQTMNRFVQFYNYKRIHSGVGYISPYKYLLEADIDMGNYYLENVLDCSNSEKEILV